MRKLLGSCLFLCCLITASAQIRITLAITVLDEAGNPLPGVTVTARPESGASIQAVTDVRGVARLVVPPGRTMVFAELAGFAIASRPVDAGVGKSEDLTFRLRTARPERELLSPRRPPLPDRPPVFVPFPLPVERPVPLMAPPPPVTTTQGVSGHTKRAIHKHGPVDVAPGKDYAVVNVYYATDRAYSGETAPARLFGGVRGNEQLRMGIARVSIPREHRLGELEEPSIWKFERREDPKKHVVLLSVQPQRIADFYAKLRGSVAASERHEAFVFIHGYKNTFADAVRRTAQIKYDLGFDGAAIAYCWPSGGAFADYSADEGTVDWTVPHLAAFLNDLAQRTGADSIHVVAHSMGNRVMAQAFARLASPEARAKFSQVVLAAPDIDADVFKRDLAPALLKLSGHVTLYASSRDEALNASKKLHRSARAGEAGNNIVIVNGIETIDVSAVDTSLIGHAYVADNQTVLSDVFCLLRGAVMAGKRCRLSSARVAAGIYWKFSAIAPEHMTLARYVCSPTNCEIPPR